MAAPPSSPSKVPTWGEWFQSRESAEIINKVAQEQLFAAFNASVTAEECKRALLDHQESAFLMVENFGTKRVAIFHHFAQQGGTVYNADTHYGMIQGLDSPMTLNVTPDESVLFAQPTGAATAIPKIADLLGVASKADITSLTVGSTTTFKARNFIPIVPFMLGDISTAITEGNGAASGVYMAVVKAIKNFDTAHAADNEYKDKARTKCKDVLAWLYLVCTGNGDIVPTPTTGCTNVGVLTKLNSAARMGLARRQASPARSLLAVTSQLQSNIQRPLEVIAASTSANQDFMRKLTQMQESNDDKSSKSFKKLPKKYQNMMLVASSVNEATVTELNPQAIEFFKASSTLNASIILNSVLETERIDCSVSNAMTTSLHHGSFLWNNSVTPSGLACCVITSEDFLRTDTLYDGLVLDYATKFEIDKSAMDKLTKTHVKFPQDVEGMIERFRALEALCKLFFGRRGLPSQGLRGLVIKCQDNKRMLKASQYHDPDFIAKLMCSVDHRIFQWLTQCSQVQSVESTTVSLLDFSSLFEDVMMHRFHYILPLAVKKISPPKRDMDKGEGSGDKDRKKARRAAMVRNEAIPLEWKLQDSENWDNVFRNKTMEGPTLSMGCKFCLKFWVKGVCYDDCKQKMSHGALTDGDKEAGAAFIQELRGESCE